LEGKLKHWNEDKGFGFISSTEAEDIFIHISALKKMNRRPIVGHPSYLMSKRAWSSLSLKQEYLR